MSFLGSLLNKTANVSQFDERNGHRLAIAPDVRVSVHNDGMAVLDISTGRVFLCNRTGARIWQGVEDGLDADEISRQISRECDVSFHLVSRHTSSFLDEVERRGLVIRSGGRRA